MLGDKLVITDYHRQAAATILPVVKARLADRKGTVAVSVSGESGSGKSEIASCLAELLARDGMKALILAQDDYFVLPPQSNHQKRLADLSWVGTGEVRLDLLARHIDQLKIRPNDALAKPLVDFDANTILVETIRPGRLDVVIAEGTYTSLLPNLELRAFIDRDYVQTRKARLKRGRDPDGAFFEKVLEIEHQEISRHKVRADVIIPPPPDEAD